MSKGYTEKLDCRCCGGTNLRKYLDLGTQPLANSYTDTPVDQDEYPLAVNVCLDCWHSQLTVVVDPDLMFKNYAYVSGTTDTLKQFFFYTAKTHHKEWTRYREYKPEECRVLDIACNDGSQLDAFKQFGWQTWGVDPAENLTPIAKAKGHTVITDYWSEEVAQQIWRFEDRPDEATTFDVILAQNVFAHTDDILGFLKACKIVMHDTSTLNIMTSQRDMIKNKEFDTVYHEHLSFFCVSSMRAIAERAGLFLNGLSYESVHGGSYVFQLGLVEEEGAWQKYDEDDTFATRLGKRLHEEELFGIDFWPMYEQFGKEVESTLTDLRNEVDRACKYGQKVVGFGAAAKGMTVLNAAQIDLAYIVDENPLKIGKYTPGRKIPIVGPEVLAAEPENVVIIPLAWNFFNEIKHKVKLLRKDKYDRFYKYFPKEGSSVFR